MTNNQLTDERLVKILSETQATIMEHNSRCVRGSVEVDARMFESMLMELQERRKAAMGREPVAWMATYHGEVSDDAIGITRSIVEAQAERFGWEPSLTEITPLYRHAQQPLVPDSLIAAVNRLLDSDGSRGCYSAIQCGDAHDEIERMLAAAPQEVKSES